MELGRRALSRSVFWRSHGASLPWLVSCALGTFLGCASTRVVPAQDPSGSSAPDPDFINWVVVQLLDDAEMDGTLDAATLGELDELLLHPLDLNGAGVERLAVLPWLGRAQVRALVNGGPFDSLDDVARLPGFGPKLARQTLPFVRIESGRKSRHRPPVTAALESKRGTWRARAGSPVFHFAARRPGAGRRGSGFASLGGSRLALLGGDLRLAHAQGLLLWSGTSAVRGTTPVLRRSRGLHGFEGATRTHVVRGGGARLERNWFGLAFVRGDHDRGPAQLVSVHLRPANATQIQLATARIGPVRSLSLGIDVEPNGGHAAVEIAGRPEALGLALGVDFEQDDFGIGARLQSTPTDFPAPLGTVSPTERRAATRGALGRVRLGGRALRVTGSALRTRRRDSDGDEEIRTEKSLQLRGRKGANGIRVRLAERRILEEYVQDEGGLWSRAENLRSLDCSLRRSLDDGWIVGLELRYREELQESRSPDTGTAWQARFERRSKRLQVTCGLVSFRVGPHGPRIAEPGIGGGLGTRWLRGDGLRLSSVLRFRGPMYDVRLALGVQSTARAPVQYDLETGLGLRYP